MARDAGSCCSDVDANAAVAERVGRISGCRGRSGALRLTIALHTGLVSRGRPDRIEGSAQAASLTDYFIEIGRLDPEERLDGRWPIR